MAAEFQLTTDAVVTGIEGYLSYAGGQPGNLTLSVYADGGDNPGVELFSTSFPLGTGETASDWRGVSGLSWDLVSGTYWAVFRADATLEFNMPVGVAGVGGVYSGGAPNPLGNEARLFDGGNIGYYWSPEPGDRLDYGVRVFGSNQRTSVPDTSSTFALAGIGLFALAGLRRACSVRTVHDA